MRTKLTRFVVVAAVAGVSTSTFALDPQTITVSDGVVFTPTLKFEHGHDDNMFATRKNRRSTWYTTIEPTFTLNLDRAKSAHQLRYRLTSKNFHESKDNSFINHHITADTGLVFNSRNRVVMNAGYHKLQDPASDLGNAEANATGKAQNAKWNTKNIGGTYTYGASSARTQVDFGLNYNELRYDNTRRINGERIYKNQERNRTTGTVTGYYAVAPKVRMLLQGGYTEYDYTSDNLRDSYNKSLLVGVAWEATAKTQGTVKIGREKKNYKKSYFKDKTTGMWEVGVSWAPVSYSTFNLKSRRGFDESTAYIGADSLETFDSITSTIRTVDTQLTWKHYWMEHLYSGAEYRHIDRKYQNYDRDDKIQQYGLSLNYQARRWLDVGIGYTHRENDSDLKNNSYKRNIYAVTFNASL